MMQDDPRQTLKKQGKKKTKVFKGVSLQMTFKNLIKYSQTLDALTCVSILGWICSDCADWF